MSRAEIHSFSKFISRYLPGKIQKITVNAGFTCPNRDGSKGTGGCIYCNNSSFSPGYTLTTRPIADQIEQGKEFFRRKYPDMRYVAYFQSYTSTNAPVSRILEMIGEALDQKDVEGVIIGTRPDCMPDSLLDELKIISKEKFVMVEYGAESANDDTLRIINRCHTWNDTADAVKRTNSTGIPVGLHLILGLPDETHSEIMHTIDEVNKLDIDILKFHQLQIVRGTALAGMIKRGECSVMQFSAEEYIELCCDVLQRLRPDIIVERFISQAPDELLISPRWGLKNYQFMDRLRQRLETL